MTPEKIQRLHGLLDQREREQTQRDGFRDYGGWHVRADYEIKGERKSEPRGRAPHRYAPSEAYSLRFTLTPNENVEVMELLRTIYQRRVDAVNAKLLAEGISLEESHEDSTSR